MQLQSLGLGVHSGIPLDLATNVEKVSIERGRGGSIRFCAYSSPTNWVTLGTVRKSPVCGPLMCDGTVMTAKIVNTGNEKFRAGRVALRADGWGTN